MRLCLLGRRDQVFLGRLGTAVENVLARRAVEHRGFLRDHPDLTPQALLGHTRDILPINRNVTLFRGIEPQ